MGSGGFAEVYKAKLEKKELAVKRTKGTDKNLLIVLNEATIMLALSGKSKYLISAEKIYFKDTQFAGPNLTAFTSYLFMEKMKTNLFSVLSRKDELDKKIRRKRLYYILIQILEGLEFLHSKGVVHSDLKPENILLNNFLDGVKDDTDIEVKITDFGCAKLMKKKKDWDLGRVTKILGKSKLYSAPELSMDKSVVATGNDIWSFGIICFCAFTLQTPWNITKDTPETTLKKHFCNEDPILNETHKNLINDVFISDKIQECTRYSFINRPLASILKKEFVEKYKKL